MKPEQFIPIKLGKGQYLVEIEPFKSSGIPTNCILHKTITGCGITSCEISYTKRSSIIILPNVPVIKGKVKEHNKKHPPNRKILGVYKDIEVSHILKYVESDVNHKKILTTPEGFSKIVETFEGRHIDLFDAYFLMYDECDRIISDIDYRDKIAAPLDLFFKFKRKALVSATVLPFSDPRFNDFQHYVIEPDFDYSKPLTLIESNNVLETLRRHLSGCKAKQTSIFLNSTNAIIAVIEKLGIANDSLVHCAPESTRKFRTTDLHIATSEFDSAELKKYNFFTSRFFSAVDMVVDYKPDVVILTDVIFAEHTMLDPTTEVVQVAGRYRKGINTLTHITNFNPNLKAKSPEEAKSYLTGCFEIYHKLVELRKEATNEGAKDTLQTAIESLFVHRYFNRGELNTFMVDNFVHDQLVRSYYQKFAILYGVYASCKHFQLSHKNESYVLGDADHLLRKSSKTQQVLNRVLANQINKLTGRLDNYVLAPEGELQYVRAQNPIVTEGYDILGITGLNQTDFSNPAIRKAITAEKRRLQYKLIVKDVYAACSKYESEDNVIPEKEILEILMPIYTAYGLKDKVRAASIKKFYEADRTFRKETGTHPYKLKRKLFTPEQIDQSIPK